MEEQPRTPGAQQSFAVMNIGFVAGVISRERLPAFERILWRTLRGNLYMNQSEIPDPIIDPSDNTETQKNVFVIFAHGKEIIAKIRKISESLGADLYSVDENSDLRRDQFHEVNTRLTDLTSVLGNTQRALHAELSQIARSLAAWLVIVRKEKGVYHTLNRCSYDQARKTLIAEAWCPTNALGLIKSTLQDVNDRAGLSVPTIVNQIRTSKTPPTYNRTNRFTECFQMIIDAYGTAKYREVNQGLPAIVTFPFLFAVMFGDLGHGLIMFVAAAAMIAFEKRLGRGKLDELVSMAFTGRYVILMMGMYSMFTGLIYNDIFSRSMELFPSAWEWPQNFTTGDSLEAKLKGSYRYPIGLDPGWHETENNLLFTNSLKMKLSILMGWCHVSPAASSSLLPWVTSNPLADDVLALPLIHQPPTFQVQDRHLRQLPPRHDLLPGHLRLPGADDRVQVGERVAARASPFAAQHAHLHVPAAGHRQRGGAAVQRPGPHPGHPGADRRALRACPAAAQAAVPALRAQQGPRPGLPRPRRDVARQRPRRRRRRRPTDERRPRQHRVGPRGRGHDHAGPGRQ